MSLLYMGCMKFTTNQFVGNFCHLGIDTNFTEFAKIPMPAES